MSDINSFFDNATPAQINQMPTAPAKDPQVQAQHPMVQPQDMGTLDQLPQVEMSEAEPDVPVVEELQAVPAPIQPEEPAESKQQKSFRELRESKLRAEWERDELARRIQSYEEAKSRPTQQQPEPEEDFGIGEDEILEGKHIAKIVKQVEKRVERKYQQQQQATMQNVTENRLKMELPDIESVLSTDNVKKLNQMYPELAQSISANPDYYSKAKAAYTLMKRLNIVEDAPAVPAYDYEADRRRIAQNSAKPKPVQSVISRQSPLAASNAYDGELTDSVRTQLWKEMQKAMKG